MPINRKDLFLLPFYGFLFIEILYFLLIGHAKLSLILTGLGAILILIRLFIFPHPNVYWVHFKEQLREILLKKQVLLPDSSNPSNTLTSTGTYGDLPLLVDPQLIDNTPADFENKHNIIQEFRSIGLDGLLICLFLMKNVEVFCSAKNIFRSINLPVTTGYRYIQKLLELNYIYTKNTFDRPQVNYFQLTIDGKFLVYDLYKIIKY